MDGPRGDSVIIGYDGSRDSELAMHWAAAEATARSAPLTVCRAWRWDSPEAPDGGDTTEMARHAAIRTLDDCLERVQRRHPAVRVDTRLQSGAPADVLENLAAQASLVVVGARGVGGFPGLPLGSVSAHVAAHAVTPVVIVRGEEVEEPGGEVLVALENDLENGLENGGIEDAIDDTVEDGLGDVLGAAAALRFAVREAGLHRAPLHVIYARRDDLHPARHGGHGPVPTAATTLLDELLRTGPPDLDLRAEALAKPLEPALLAASRGARLLVVGAPRPGGRQGVRHLGAGSRAVIRQAACSVAVLDRSGP